MWAAGVPFPEIVRILRRPREQVAHELLQLDDVELLAGLRRQLDAEARP